MLPVSLYASADFTTSLPKLTGILLGVSVFYAIVNTTLTLQHTLQLVGLLILAATAMAGFSLVGTNWNTGKLPIISQLYQFLPTYTHNLTGAGGFHPNQVGGTMILVVPLSLAVLFKVGSGNRSQSRHLMHALPTRTWRHRHVIMIPLVMCVLLMLSTLVLTQSRSALFGLSIALLVLLALQNRVIGITFVALVILAGIIVWRVGTMQEAQLFLDTITVGSAAGTIDFVGRQELWSRAIYMLQDFPYTGVGLGMFNQVLHVLYPAFLISPEANVFHAHNVFLQVGVDLGLPGLVAYIGLITTFFGVTWHARCHAQAPHLRAIALGLLGGMVAYHVYGLTDAMALGAKPGVFLWTLFGLAAAIERHLTQES